MDSTTGIRQLGFFCEEPFQKIARIEGIATLEDHGVRFDYALKQCGTPTPKSTVTKLLPYGEIASVEVRHHWISATKIRFRATRPEVLETYHTTDPAAFEIEVLAGCKMNAERFVEAANARLGQMAC